MADDAHDEREYFARAREFLANRERWCPSGDAYLGRDTHGQPLSFGDIGFIRLNPTHTLTLIGTLTMLASNWPPRGIANATAHDRAFSRLQSVVGDIAEYNGRVTHAELLGMLMRCEAAVMNDYKLPPRRAAR